MEARNGYVLKTSYLQGRAIATQIMHRLFFTPIDRQFAVSPNLNIPWRQEGLTSLGYCGQIMGVTGRLWNMHSKDDLNNNCSGGSGPATHCWQIKSSFIRTQFHRNSGCVDGGGRCWQSKCPSGTITAVSSAVADFAGFCGFAERLTRPRRECSRWCTGVGVAAPSACKQPTCRGHRTVQRTGPAAPTATRNACAGVAEGDESWRQALEHIYKTENMRN